MVAQVIVDVVHSNVAKPFSYLIPNDLSLQVGQRVRVPLGRRQVDGLIVEILADSELPAELPIERLRAVSKPLEDYPVVLPALLALAEELAAQDHCPLAETLRMMLPAGMRTGRTVAKKEGVAQLSPELIGNEARFQAAVDAQKRSAKRAMLLRLLRDGKPHAIHDLQSLVSDPNDALKRLAQDGFVRVGTQALYRQPYEALPDALVPPPKLTDEQELVLRAMLPALEGGSGSFLLHGVTGSGKTEVYMALVRRCLQLGKGAIILVPEIALTPQMVRWFRERFGNQTAVLHSRLSDGQRFDEWQRIRTGQARVVVGARSAVFAPMEGLGLIVVDEEHEQTYLSDKHPRYDARQIAMSRARRESATVLLSSATPSILSFAMARRGDYTLVEMPTRVHNRPLPEVAIVDMRQELASGNRSLFSALLQQRLRECVNQGHQAMLFLNRRGYNSFVSCRSCGYVVKCDQCDLSMTLHQATGKPRGELRCHLCGAVREPPDVCPECGSRHIRFFGAGTQRVEDEMKKLFPDIRTLRMDLDTTGGKDAHYRLLDAFGRGDAQVLIGTQMIAKGLDFPNVTLVGVVAADMTLNLPDYRAQERTFQLITQVAGRAGRAQDKGFVVVQTYKPDHPCILAAADQDYRGFFTQEFARRRTGLYPPFTVLARLLVESPDAPSAKAMGDRLYEALQTYLLAHPEQKRRVLMLRADDAPVKLIRGKHRYEVLLKLFEHPDAKPVLATMAELARAGDERTQVYLEVNPVTMM